ncbi:Meckel syndrome type 1 protein [Halotydeus destructor]|nr:Meckel syndrome type 1 protein [Halotydeus destructor]
MVSLPNGWYSNNEKELYGRTQRCYPTAVRALNISFPVSVTLNCENNSDEWPFLFVRVISVDYWNKHRLCGQGFVRLPHSAGQIILDIPCMKFVSHNLFDRLSELFLGHDMEELSKQTLPDVPCPTQFDQLAEFTGTVTVKLNCITRSSEPRLEKKSSLQSIADVVLAFERAKSRMMALKKRLADMESID